MYTPLRPRFMGNEPSSKGNSGPMTEPVSVSGAWILELRGQRVILDADLALLYRVSTARLNEQVGRNRGRFPPDFAFRLSAAEKAEVIANCDHLHNLRFSRHLPRAFTEHGALMAASVLHSERAVAMSILVVRTFVRVRAILAGRSDLQGRVAAIERRVEDHDDVLAELLAAIRGLLEGAPNAPEGKIGFRGP